MRNRNIAILIVVLVLISGFHFEKMNVLAKNMQRVDESVDVEIEENQARGIYLAEGNSSISKTGTYTINATGVTSAARKCTVSVLVTVEQFRNDKWYYYTSWQTTRENAFTASISNTIYVDLGYYYRVVSVHGAETDSSSSFTNAIWMGL